MKWFKFILCHSQQNKENKIHYILIHSFLNWFILDFERDTWIFPIFRAKWCSISTYSVFRHVKNMSVLSHLSRQTYSASKWHNIGKLIFLISQNIQFESHHLILLRNVILSIEYFLIFYLTNILSNIHKYLTKYFTTCKYLDKYLYEHIYISIQGVRFVLTQDNY